MQKNRSVPDVQRKRSKWTETISGANAEHQIYLDESGINTNLTRHYAHAVHGKRAMDATPINTPAGTTVLSSIRLNGSLVYTTYQGGTTAQRFREYMEKQLIPSLEKDDVVIMDNCYNQNSETHANNDRLRRHLLNDVTYVSGVQLSIWFHHSSLQIGRASCRERV